MDLRMGAGGIPLVPFAGDPNGGGGPTPVVGQVLVDTVGGGVYQGVMGGFFNGNSDLVSNSSFGFRNPSTMSTCWSIETEFVANPTSAYAILSERNEGVGIAILIQPDGKVDVSVRISSTQGYRFTFGSKLGLGQQRIAINWNHLTSTMTAWCGFEKQSISALVTVLGTLTSSVIEARNSGVHRTPYYCRSEYIADESILDDWAQYKTAYKPVDCDVLFDMSRATLSAGQVPNLGSLGGFFSVTDNTPTTWNSDYWRRIA
jgi:hypothetical protein